MGTTRNDTTGFTAARDDWAVEQTIIAQAEHEANGWDDAAEDDAGAEQEIAQPRALAPVTPQLFVASAQQRSLSEPRWSREDELALKNTVAKDCTDAQFRVFMGAARRLGLDPFARQIVPIVQGGKMTPQTTIDGFRLIAERTGKYAGQMGPVWCGKDGEWREVWLDDGLPLAAKVGVLRRDFAQPLYDVAHMRSYKKETPTWTKLPIEMLAKVAEARALRRAFPQELSGVYTDDEMGVVDADPSPQHAQSSTTAAAVSVVESAHTWDDVKKLAGELRLSTADKTALFTNHNQDPEAIYAALVARRDALAKRPYNPIGDAAFMKRAERIGYKFAGQIDELLTRAGLDPAAVTREQADAALHEQERAASAAGLRSGGKGA